ncbi:Carnitine O-palmitoyltransferase 1, liver isoform, partial [Trichinella sp. T6]
LLTVLRILFVLSKTMAEAHSAVAFGFTVSHDGVSLNYDKELLKIVYQSISRSYKRRVARFKNNLRAGIYPASPSSYVFIVAVMVAVSLANIDLSFGLIDWAQKQFFGISFTSLLFCSVVYSSLCWLAIVQIARLTIKLMFMYRGWMYERLRNTRMATKFYLLIVKLILKHEPMLKSFQGALPRLPLPALRDTLRRHLDTLKPLLNDESRQRMERLSNEFENTIGPKLQRYLTLKSWLSGNYVSDWWEEYVYLRGRSALMINSNFYGLDSLGHAGTTIQAARAANITYASLLFRRLIERQELKPILIGVVPLCSSQYERTFNTCRIPGVEIDTLKHWNDARHIAVYCHGAWFKVLIHDGRRLLKPCELQIIFSEILNNCYDVTDDERHLGALTAIDRTSWAEIRQKYFSVGVNRSSLHAIESSAFTLCFDEEEYFYDSNDTSKLDHWAHMNLHGKGYDRWFDKSFNLIVSKNGKVGINAEHSWYEFLADAPIMSHYFEYATVFDILKLGYTAEGNCIGDVDITPVPARRLKWDFTPELSREIADSVQKAEALINDVEMALIVFREFGKGFIKKCQISPDGFIQMILQLTYFRDQRKFCLTYEASMTRLYREGRTETVRPVTFESCAFVRAMCDDTCSIEQRRDLLYKACEKHQKAYLDAMCGKGVDRHLFCLYIVSRYLQLDSPFLKEVLSEPWRLSTSQTPQQQTDLVDTRKYPDYVSAGGGFGPVADDGYGISYIIGGENIISFHISSKRYCETTSSTRFRETLLQSLRDVRSLFDD